MKQIADDEIMRLASSKEVSSADLERLADVLSKDKPMEDFANALKGELWENELIGIGAIPDPATSKPEDFEVELRGHRFPVDRKATVTMLGSLYQKRLNGLSLPFKDQPNVEKEIDGLTAILPKDWISTSAPTMSDIESLKMKVQLRSIKNPFGLRTVAYAQTVLGAGMLESFVRSLREGRMQVLALRTTSFYRQHGTLPKSLSEVKGTNIDPFSGKPFAYNPTTRLIESSSPEGVKPLSVTIPN
ncbi:hypothetical protein BH11ARM1_BH11ARM1_15330 [soil metagenome]